LRKISSFGAILMESLDGKIGQEDQENLEFMIDGAERMTKMIEDLLAYSRLNTRTLAVEEVNLNDVVEQLETLDFGKLLDDTGARLKIPEPLLKIHVDPTMARQLMRNLIIHAIKHRREDTNLQIVLKTARITEDEVKVECEYNGTDINVENDEDIFKMSLRSHSRQEYEEAGSGLAICRKIVDRHGGRIGIESKADAGTTLWFTLPVPNRSELEQGESPIKQTVFQT
jgi:light-regulated signal transduction histidine kinase (bacteriophytochrome)